MVSLTAGKLMKLECNVKCIAKKSLRRKDNKRTVVVRSLKIVSDRKARSQNRAP